jgi:hypothetical protein
MARIDRARDAAAGRAEDVASAYSGQEDRPLGGYLAILGFYATTVAMLGLAVKLRRERVPERVAPSDLLLLTVATHKAARVLSKDPVTSPLRAPFTRFAGQSGEAEVKEEVRGTGIRHAIGELISCPFCLGMWIGTFFTFGLLLAPRFTRWTASVFMMLTGSDLLQVGYAKVQEALE